MKDVLDNTSWMEKSKQHSARLISKSLRPHALQARIDKVLLPKSFEAFYKRHFSELSRKPVALHQLRSSTTFSAAVANGDKCPYSPFKCISVCLSFALTSNSLLIAENVNFSSLHTFSIFVFL